MPIIYDCTQGSEQWARLRCGIPTASCFDRIVTPTGKVSSQQTGYRNELLAELLLGRPLENVSMPWMTRGNELEDDAAAWFEFQRDVITERVGFITTDDGQYGASPDRLVGANALLELKCPSPQIQIGYILSGDGKSVDRAYYPQLMGQLLVSGRERERVYICAYHPKMPSVVITVERDEEFIALLEAQLDAFCDKLAEGKAELERRGLLPKPSLADGVTFADFEMPDAPTRKQTVLSPEMLAWADIDPAINEAAEVAGVSSQGKR